MFYLYFLAFLLASFITLASVYLKASTTTAQQTVAVLLLLLLLTSKRFVFSPQGSSKLYRFLLTRFILVTLSALFVQLLILSSGGFYSPFLILIHLYTLGASFLVNIATAITFMVLSLLVLIASTFLNETLRSFFQSDPATAVIYLISFIVIVPLAQYLMRTYHLKDAISKVLTEHLQIGEKREQSILRGLTELVLVTDVNLRILSINEAVEKMLQISTEQIVGSFLLNTLSLKDRTGSKATSETLAIDQVLNDKASRIVEGFTLQSSVGREIRVVIQIRPVVSVKGNVNQIVFVITEGSINKEGQHSNLEIVKQKQRLMADRLKKALTQANLPNLKIQAELFSKTEEDLIIALEIEDHPIKQSVSYQDIAALCEKVVSEKQEFANSLGVNAKFILPQQEVGEAALLSLKKTDVSSEVLSLSDFAVPVDYRWLELVLQKLTDLSILLASGLKNSSVSLMASRPDANFVDITITGSAPNLSNEDLQKIFQRYYGDLVNRTNLRLGSGLEGFIAKVVADSIDISIKANWSDNLLIFQIQLTKNPRLT